MRWLTTGLLVLMLTYCMGQGDGQEPVIQDSRPLDKTASPSFSRTETPPAENDINGESGLNSINTKNDDTPNMKNNAWILHKSQTGGGVNWERPSMTLTEDVEIWKLPSNGRTSTGPLPWNGSLLQRLKNSTNLRHFLEKYRMHKVHSQTKVASEIGHLEPDTFSANHHFAASDKIRPKPNLFRPSNSDEMSAMNVTTPYHEGKQNGEEFWPMHRPTTDQLSGRTAKDYEIAIWFGFALGALFVVVIGGSIALVRRIMPSRFKSAFQRFPYGQVKDLSFPPGSYSEFPPQWSPLKMSTSEPNVYVCARDGQLFQSDQQQSNGPC